MLVITFSGTSVLLGLAGLCLLVGLTIFLLRRSLANRYATTPGKRHKNAAFSFTGPVHRLSLCVAIAASLIAINWTQFDAEPATYSGVIEIDDTIEIDIPITADPPPPLPPPPPPPVIEAVVDVVEDPPTFVDQEIDEKDPVTEPAPPPPPAPAAAPKYVPPPPAPEEGPDIFLFVEHMPLFDESCKELPKEERKSCSDRKLLQFIMANVNYPAMARENGIEGTAVISFTVEKDGSVSEIEAVREVAGGCTEAALKAVAAINRKGKKFTPGIQQGREVRVRFNLPVAFRLE